MRRWLLLALFAFLLADAGGLTAFAGPDACTFASTDRGPDGSCPTFCVRCGCCATPILHTVADAVDVFALPTASLPRIADGALPSGIGPEILHVPKFRLA
ncbi:MAG: hypothetical protein WBD07_01150 [Vicinamibacterales bacterium]